ncbi:MAG: SAM-dependent methyltransferase [Desulfobacterota bacterium]|nr:SAM-dependent methyltransferase [Thermodesulfobacteriota bacterium]
MKAFILSRLEAEGPVPFAQFMEWCLYHPQYGYYRSGQVRAGKGGDYYTAPCVHPLFGGMVARQLSQMADGMGQGPFEVLEIGGGRGFLCLDILTWAREKIPEFFRRLRYLLLETNSHLIEEQRDRLSSFEKEGRVAWIDPETFEKGVHRLTGCVLSNELIDAFPVHRVVMEGGRLKEIYVTQDRGELKEVLGEPSDPALLTYFDSLGIRLPEGYRTEVNLRALRWMENVGRFLDRGFVLTIDYGYLAEERYAPHRCHGTLLGYFRHRTSSNPYQHLGEQDLTSHVNFTDLIRKGEEVGLRFLGLVPQYRFLIALGILQEADFLGQDLSNLEGLKMRLSLMHLIEPEAGMGESYQVLIQGKGVGQPHLDGLRDLETIPWPDLSPDVPLRSPKPITPERGSP